MEKCTIRIPKPPDFNLDHIFDCGQCFRWEKEEDGSYTGIAFGRPVNMSVGYDEDGKVSLPPKEARRRRELRAAISNVTQYTHHIDAFLTIENATFEEVNTIWKPYLDWERDYSAIKEELASKDEVMANAIEKGKGIRILRQDLWEALLSFTISQNNNIPRIKGCIENLAREFGEPAGTYRGKEFYNLPTAARLAELTPEELAPIKLGYRARYIIEMSKAVVKDGLPQGYWELVGLTGVGPKVASCVSLFGLHNMASFPVDVWVRRVMNRLYGIAERDTKAMHDFAKENFGQYGGIAQQYLFYYIRTQGLDVTREERLARDMRRARLARITDRM